MAKFTVFKLVDAYVKYYAEVEADTAEEARDIAKDYTLETQWEAGDTIEFDDAKFGVEDEDGDEVLEAE